MRPLFARTGERVRYRSLLHKEIWKRTRSDIMIIIHFPDIKKGGFVNARTNLLDDVFQPLIPRHVVYKIARNSNEN